MAGDVLEVGAGIGTNAKLFSGSDFSRWWCLEPDPLMAARLGDEFAGEERHRVVSGTIRDLDPELRFDTVLYLDVLEHIRDDAAELDAAAGRLRAGGHLAVLAPAHAGLSSALDEAVGHHRRYTGKTLRSVVPGHLECVSVRYMDSIGMLASFANRAFLRQRLPTAAQVRFWDDVLVPGSVVLDRLLGHRLGKSVLGIWTRVDE